AALCPYLYFSGVQGGTPANGTQIPDTDADMDNVDLNILRQVVAWRESGHRVVMGTVTRTWGSAPRPVGSVVAVRDDGAIAGSVSGGCIEDDLIERTKAHAL